MEPRNVLITQYSVGVNFHHTSKEAIGCSVSYSWHKCSHTHTPIDTFADPGEKQWQSLIDSFSIFVPLRSVCPGDCRWPLSLRVAVAAGCDGPQSVSGEGRQWQPLTNSHTVTNHKDNKRRFTPDAACYLGCDLPRFVSITLSCLHRWSLWVKPNRLPSISPDTIRHYLKVTI